MQPGTEQGLAAWVRVARCSLLAAVGLTLLLLLALLVTLAFASVGAERKVRALEQRLARSAIEEKRRSMRTIASESTFWGEADQRVPEAFHPKFATDHRWAYLKPTFGVQASSLVGRDDAVRGARDGGLADAAAGRGRAHPQRGTLAAQRRARHADRAGEPPAAAGAAGRADRRGRAGALEPPGARRDPARRVHRDRRGHRGDRRARPGGPWRRPVATRSAGATCGSRSTSRRISCSMPTWSTPSRRCWAGPGSCRCGSSSRSPSARCSPIRSMPGRSCAACAARAWRWRSTMSRPAQHGTGSAPAAQTRAVAPAVTRSVASPNRHCRSTTQ